MRDVEKDALGTGALHFGVDGPSHDVARGEVFQSMVTCHECRAILVDEAPTFAPHGFADEE